MRRFVLCLGVFTGGVVTAADPPPGVARPADVNEVRTHLGLLPYTDTATQIGKIKIAVLDSGFAGAKARPYLPQSAVLVESYDPEFVLKHNLGDPTFQKPLNPGDAHGRQLAQLVWATTGNWPDGPKFYLLNANG